MTCPKNKFVNSVGTDLEVFRCIADAVMARGGTDDDLRRVLTENGIADKIAQVLVTKVEFPSLILAARHIPEGWTIVEDVQPTLKSVDDLTFKGFLRGRETNIDSEELRKRAVQMEGNLGLADVPVILEQQAKLPKEFRSNYYYIPLPGTVLRDPNDDLRAPHLRFDDGTWVVEFFFLHYSRHHDGLGRFGCSK